VGRAILPAAGFQQGRAGAARHRVQKPTICASLESAVYGWVSGEPALAGRSPASAGYARGDRMSAVAAR